MPSFDCIIWLAALVGDGACAINPDIAKEINQSSVKWLCQNFKGKIYFTSTCSVYGQGDGLLTEVSPKNPLSVYAKTKLAAESYLLDHGATIFRLGTVFGVSDSYSRIRMDLVVNAMTMNALLKGELYVQGGEQWRPLIHVRDIAYSIVESLEKESHGIFNLHYENITIKDLAQRITKIVGGEIIYTELPFQDQRNYKVSSDKARGELGFYPVYPIELGIKQVRDLVISKRIKNPLEDIYHNQKYLDKIGVS